LAELPKVKRVKIQRLRRRHGTQYVMTIPVEYGRTLDKLSVDSLILAFDRGLSGIPETDPDAEQFLLAFLTRHKELRRFFSLEKREKEKEAGPEGSHVKAYAQEAKGEGS
jgi:hypothetical protein